MKKSLTKSVLIVFFTVFTLFNLFAIGEHPQNDSDSSYSYANKRTAIRYLKISRQYLTDKNWAEAEIQASSGIEYDASIADLWYVKAVAQYNNGIAKSVVIETIQKAMSINNWVDYNKEGARVFCAMVLCDIKNYDDALLMLDEDSFIYSADAEYIRIKSYYSKGSQQSILTARNHINTACKIYPYDVRFADLFFYHEYKNAEDDEVNKMAQYFLHQLASYKNVSSETELLATYFAPEQMRVRMLKAFNAKGLKHPLYIVLALQSGLIKQREALDQFYFYAGSSIGVDIVRQFVKLITDESLKNELKEYITSYSGSIVFTDDDFTGQVKVSYERGRPALIVYDHNQDGYIDWECECDFGVPISLRIKSSNFNITYDPWPAIKAVDFKYESDSVKTASFDIVALSFEWTPFDLYADKCISDVLGLDLYVPYVKNEINNLTLSDIYNNASGYVVPSQEYNGAHIKTYLLDGAAQKTEYIKDGKVYAYAFFENGIPSVRMVDRNFDGVYETKEEYDINTSVKKTVTKIDEMQMMLNIFGSVTESYGLYLKSVHVDRDINTIYEYSEEYSMDGKTESLWDFDQDGQWDIKYVKHPSDKDGVVRKETYFYKPLSNICITVVTENNKPVSIYTGDEEIKIYKDDSLDFYSIGTPIDTEIVKRICEKYNQSDNKGVYIIEESDGDRYYVVAIENKLFGEKLPKTLVHSDEIK